MAIEHKKRRIQPGLHNMSSDAIQTRYLMNKHYMGEAPATKAFDGTSMTQAASNTVAMEPSAVDKSEKAGELL